MSTQVRYARTAPLPTLSEPLTITLDAHAVEQLDAYRKLSHALRRGAVEGEQATTMEACRRLLDRAQEQMAMALDRLVRDQRGEPRLLDDYAFIAD